MDIEVLRDWMADARRSLEKEADRLREKEQQANDLMRCLETTDELVSEVSRLRDQLENRRTWFRRVGRFRLRFTTTSSRAAARRCSTVR